MSRGRGALSAYGCATRLYPKAFRTEYREDLIALMSDQLGEEATWRVVVRSAVDLAITIPARHVEAHMNRSPLPIVPIVFATAAFALVVVGVIVGHPVVLLACAAAGVASAALAVTSARRLGLLTSERPASAQWWKVLLAGVAAMGALVVVTSATGELSQPGWVIAMAVGLTALLVMGAGVALGIAHFASRSSRRPAGV